MIPLAWARAAWTGEFFVPNAVVWAIDGRIAEVSSAPPGFDALVQLDGLLIPGLVNAHLHLELSEWAGRVSGGEGLPKWVGALMKERGSTADPRPAMVAAALALRNGGTVAVCDIANGPETASILDEAGLQGVVQREVLTLDAKRLGERLQEVATLNGTVGGITVRPSPHAPYSTAPALIRAAVGLPRLPPASIHLAEDRAELQWVKNGDGPWARFLDRIGVDWRWWQPPGGTPVEYLDEIGVLGPGLLVVHGVHLAPKDRTILAQRGSALCLCPRSNFHIGGELPDVPALLSAGVRLCLGTDSLASSGSLDVLDEIPVLAEAFPEVPLETWFRIATAGGASALGIADLGQLTPGCQAKLTLLEGISSFAEFTAATPRRAVG